MLSGVTANDGGLPPPENLPGDPTSEDQPTMSGAAAPEAGDGTSGDDTQVRPPSGPAAGPSGTAIMPVLPGDGAGDLHEPAPGSPRWEGRAEVPLPPRSEEYGEPFAEPPRSVLIPVLLTVCVMLLLGVLALGAWLILSNRPSPTPPSQPSPTRTFTTPPRTVGTTVTTPPATTDPALVSVPKVSGKDYATAERELTEAGLVPVRKDVPDSAPAGTVLGTDPAEGTPVPHNAHVTVLVSLGPESPPVPTADPTSS